MIQARLGHHLSNMNIICKHLQGDILYDLILKKIVNFNIWIIIIPLYFV